MLLKMVCRPLILVLLFLTTVIAAGAPDGDEKPWTVRGAVSVALGSVLTATDPIVTGPPIALYAAGCGIVDLTKCLCHRIS